MAKQTFILNLINVKTQKVVKSFKLEKNKEYIIGRSQQADITIPHDTLSRKHAQINVSKKTAQIKDLGSVNGTYIDGQQIKENQVVYLTNGLNLYFGECEDKLQVIVEKQKKEDSEESESSTENLKKEKKSKKDKKQKRSVSRSRSRSQDKQSQKQTNNYSQLSTNTNNSQSEDVFSKKQNNLTPRSTNLQFGNQKADLTSKFGNKANVIDSKRKLLWGNKTQKEIPKEKQLWNKLDENQATGIDKVKFMKLMGVKNAEEKLQEEQKSKVSDGGLIMKSAADTLNQKESVNDILEKQYNKSINRRFMGSRGLGN